MLLENKVAVVTGSSRGIGAATARMLAANGARVAVNYHSSREHGEAVVDKISEEGGRSCLLQADVTDPEQVANLMKQVEAELGPIDILVNNANISFPVVPFIEYAWDDFHRKLTKELQASFFCCCFPRIWWSPRFVAQAVADHGVLGARRRTCIALYRP